MEQQATLDAHLAFAQRSEGHDDTARPSELWLRVIPWTTTAVSLLILAGLATFLAENLYWFRSMAVSQQQGPEYAVHAFHIYLSMVKRSVGLFAGFALIFLGSSVTFYTLKRRSEVAAGGAGISGGLKTASPGEFAMVLGTLLIMWTIYSKDAFPAPPSGARAGAEAAVVDAPAQQPTYPVQEPQP